MTQHDLKTSKNLEQELEDLRFFHRLTIQELDQIKTEKRSLEERVKNLSHQVIVYKNENQKSKDHFEKTVVALHFENVSLTHELHQAQGKIGALLIQIAKATEDNKNLSTSILQREAATERMKLGYMGFIEKLKNEKRDHSEADANQLSELSEDLKTIKKYFETLAAQWPLEK